MEAIVELDYVTLDDLDNAIEMDGAKTNAFQVLASYRLNQKYEDVRAQHVGREALLARQYGVRLPEWDKIKAKFSEIKEPIPDWENIWAQAWNCRNTEFNFTADFDSSYRPGRSHMHGSRPTTIIIDDLADVEMWTSESTKRKSTYSRKRSPKNRRSRK